MGIRIGGGRPSHRLRVPSFEDLRASLWLLPAISAAVALGAALVLSEYRPAASSGFAHALWPGGRDGATATLTTLAGSVITVTSLTFTLVVVALQLASQQFSPRLLREFARDRMTQGVLSLLFGTFAFALSVLRGLDPHRPLPVLALLIAFLLGAASVFGLIAFLGHIIRSLRVDTMMAAVHSATASTIVRCYPPQSSKPGPSELALVSEDGTLALSSRSGFVQRVDVDALTTAADAAGARVQMLARPGDQIVRGTPLASIAGGGDRDALAEDVRAAVEIGHERTLEEDPAYGFRQLVDIAVKALSPGVNDPETAAHAISHLADLLAVLMTRRVGPVLSCGSSGEPRVLLADRDVRYYLELSFGQIRRYGAPEPTVLVAVLRALRDVAMSAHDGEQRTCLREQVDRVLSTASGDMHGPDRALLELAGRAVQDVLDGRPRQAYEVADARLRAT